MRENLQLAFTFPDTQQDTQQRVMDKIAIVRHGYYGTDGHLSDYGREQMMEIGNKLKRQLTVEEVVLILSSTAPRTVDSAEVLEIILGAKKELHELLWSEAGRREDYIAAHQLVQSVKNRADLVVVVTHCEYANGFPAFLGKTDLGRNFSYPDIGKGEGVLINYKTCELTIL